MLELLDGKSMHGCCYRRVTSGGGRGEVSPALFQNFEKSALILEKNALIVSILGLISHFKCGFISFQEKKKTYFLPVGLFVHVLQMKCLSNTLIPRKLPWPEIFLVTRLCQNILLAFWRNILIKDFHFFYFKRDKVGYDNKFTFVNKVINSLETV